MESKNETVQLLDEIYKNVTMGSETILDILPKVKSENLRRDMTVQLEGYEKFAARAAALLSEKSIEPKEEPLTKKLSSKLGIAVNTLTDSSAPHLADMMIKGADAGAKTLSSALICGDDVEEKAVRLGSEVVEFEMNNIRRMAGYLEEK